MSNNLLVLQSDFGLVDGAVSAMIGVALQEAPTLGIHNLTHEITPYNIFEASYRLFQTVEYWPQGTTFVSVVDPGVGSDRKSVVALTSRNQYIVTPDNGTLSYIKKHVGIKAVREISEIENRRRNTELSYTFHGRDVYAFTGAKLASGHISFEEVGEKKGPWEQKIYARRGRVITKLYGYVTTADNLKLYRAKTRKEAKKLSKYQFCVDIL